MAVKGATTINEYKILKWVDDHFMPGSVNLELSVAPDGVTTGIVTDIHNEVMILSVETGTVQVKGYRDGSDTRRGRNSITEYLNERRDGEFTRNSRKKIRKKKDEHNILRESFKKIINLYCGKIAIFLKR